MCKIIFARFVQALGLSEAFATLRRQPLPQPPPIPLQRIPQPVMKEPYEIPMRLSVHHPKLNVPVLWWRSVGSTHTAYVMETLIDEIARGSGQDPVAYRMCPAPPL